MPSTNCILGAGLALAFGISAAALAAEVSVGGAAMLPTRNIVENASSSKAHVILVQAVKAAELADDLAAKGPITVFAPVNSAFAALPEGVLEDLLKDANKAQLVDVLNYHVVPGNLTYGELEKAIKADRGGEAKLTTLSGVTLIVKKNGPRNIIVKDAMNNIANISTYDVLQSNGVVHVIDRVLLPK